MKFGINTFLFTSPFTTDSIALFPKFKQWGFDSVELAIEDAAHIDAAAVRKALDDNGLVCDSICGAFGPGRDLRGTAEEQQGSVDYIKSILDIMPTLGCTILSGPMYSTVGRTEPVEDADYKQQWDTVVGHLKQLAPYAHERGLKLAIEPLNRYETDFINTVDQGLKMIADVNHEAVVLHYDTFHMNIEEKDQADAIVRAGDKLGHFHACGSDRGTPGQDHLDWTALSNALKKVNYNGPIVIESFTTDVKVIARAASIWRKLAPSQDDIAKEGLKFLKSVL
ncbi:sugar phosphate isomerase/epimerase [Mucilaginibacter hurinus]|uniref:Sugar phosphate isomerase/epimerase n=1 Tax=Mucilaginibacter hurinus TaxID=2201324 RepID=A0A367GMD8_9SPHI|nr:sugar phosphate isomerase/epimerase family protein [Mucilaginibacter hurinus]RCH53863.1 sugar phosphate isomerase/epimerase [Mucilaginibacter hurinus]